MSNSGLGKGFIILGIVILFGVVLNPKVTIHFAKIAQKKGYHTEATVLSIWFMMQIAIIVALVYLPFYLMGFK
jgi:uncharacterized membrane protein YidH (DUF202 family)